MKKKLKKSIFTDNELEIITQELNDYDKVMGLFLNQKTTRQSHPPKYVKKNNVICFSVTSDGTSGEQWIKRLKRSGYRVTENTKTVLQSKDFNPTCGVTTQIVILSGKIWTKRERITRNIRQYAKEHQLLSANIETACLIREKFTNRDIHKMGINFIVVMHKPFKEKFDFKKICLFVGKKTNYDLLEPIARLYFEKKIKHYGLMDQKITPSKKWAKDDGFAFIIS